MNASVSGSDSGVEERLADLCRVDPDPEAVSRARSAALSAFDRHLPQRRRLRLPIAIAACVLVSGASGAWAAAAAASALPGDTAYGLKRAVEQAQLTVALGGEAEVEILLSHADRRFAEAVRAEAIGRPEAVEAALYGYGNVMDDLAPRVAAVPSAALRARAERARQVHRDVLNALVDSLPPPARAALRERLADPADLSPGFGESNGPRPGPSPGGPPGGPAPGDGDGRSDGTPADAGREASDARPEAIPDPAPAVPGPAQGENPAPDPPVPPVADPKPGAGRP